MYLDGFNEADRLSIAAMVMSIKQDAVETSKRVKEHLNEHGS